MADAATDVGTLQEVVVTAQKRTENLQNVPISIEVLDNTDARAARHHEPRRLREVLAERVLRRARQGQGGNGEPGTSHIYMRGVVSGGDGNHSGSQPSVGTYFDEQPVTTIDGTVDVHLYDIQRIEVLEGPQGTLYGASSEAGTIRIITQQAGPQQIRGRLRCGRQRGDPRRRWLAGRRLRQYPLSPIAAVRLVGWDEHDAGYIDNVAGTNVNACIVNGVRTFPTWDGSTSNSPG